MNECIFIYLINICRLFFILGIVVGYGNLEINKTGKGFFFIEFGILVGRGEKNNKLYINKNK